tara:strand:+ start:3409 stop:3942 length:534 start_codon:yes stop_codon:yes gene_type:complete
MPWKHNNIAIKAGKAWSDKDGVQHPANWMIWTDPEKKAKGLTWEDEPDTSFDNRFYYSKGVEKSLTDILVTDEKGEKVIDPMTGKQMVQEGLKTQYITQTKQTANDMLSKTDWMIVRNAEKSTAIPEATTKFRDSVRTKCAEIETAINACSSLAQFMKLFEAEKLGDNPPMYDWPTE